LVSPGTNSAEKLANAILRPSAEIEDHQPPWAT